MDSNCVRIVFKLLYRDLGVENRLRILTKQVQQVSTKWLLSAPWQKHPRLCCWILRSHFQVITTSVRWTIWAIHQNLSHRGAVCCGLQTQLLVAILQCHVESDKKSTCKSRSQGSPVLIDADLTILVARPCRNLSLWHQHRSRRDMILFSACWEKITHLWKTPSTSSLMFFVFLGSNINSHLSCRLSEWQRQF